MKQAIVFGATGLIGSSIVNTLQVHNIPTIAIGRRDFQLTNLNIKPDNYIQMHSKDDFSFDHIYNQCKKICLEDDIVFYNVAWSGLDRLTNGALSDQIKNIFLSSKALEFAKQLNCSKFINVSSQEDAIFKNYIQTQEWKNSPYSSSPLFYASTKHFNKDITNLLAYLNKIDYINTRFSATITPSLDGVSFISSTLQKIKNKQDYTQPQNKNLCEIVDLYELSEAYYHIGMYGKNKADYYLGLGQPHTLQEYFDYFSKIVVNLKCSLSQDEQQQDLAKLFDSHTLKQDTNFVFKKDFPTLVKEILNQ